MQALFQIQAATCAARMRMADNSISTRVEGGQIQVVRVTYPNGTDSEIKPVSDWMPVSQVCSYLAALQ